MFQILKSFWTGLVRLGKSILCSIKRATIFSVQRAAMFFLALCTSASQLFASSTGAGGFTKATTEISSYQTPVSNLMKAIAAVIVLVGAFNVYFKMQNGDQDVKKTIIVLLINVKGIKVIQLILFYQIT